MKDKRMRKKKGNKEKVQMYIPEEEPLKKRVAFEAGEEEGLSGRIRSGIVQHRQLPLYFFHLSPCHFPLFSAWLDPIVLMLPQILKCSNFQVPETGIFPQYDQLDRLVHTV